MTLKKTFFFQYNMIYCKYFPVNNKVVYFSNSKNIESLIIFLIQMAILIKLKEIFSEIISIFFKLFYEISTINCMFVIVQITHKNSSYPMSYPMVKQKWEALKTLIKFNGFENLFLRQY